MKDLTQHIAQKLDGLGDQYRSAVPFPHIVVDDLLPTEVLDRVIADFPAPEDRIWKERIQDRYQKKLASNAVEYAPESIRDLLYQLNAAAVLKALEALTGEKELISDPYFMGGGLHQIEPGGMLTVHADFNKHPHLTLYRRLNLILYLNKNWQEEYGGHLELWDREGTARVKAVAPVANRCVIFTTDTTSFHGHPVPLSCPEGMSRKSLAVYYYSPLHPSVEHTGGTTRWRKDLAAEQQRKGTGIVAKAIWKVSYRLAGLASRLE